MSFETGGEALPKMPVAVLVVKDIGTQPMEPTIGGTMQSAAQLTQVAALEEHTTSGLVVCGIAGG